MARVNLLSRDWYILRNYVLTREKKPFLASYKLTYRCNLSCQQCPFHQLRTAEPAYPEVLATLNRLYLRGSRMVVFEGGEPLLWRDGDFTIREVIEQARRKFFSVGLTTNGTLPLDVCPDILWVSIDGLRDTHNRLRGADIFDRVIANIRQCDHPKLLAHITVNTENYREIPDLILFLSSLVKGITIQFYYPYGHDDALFLDLDKRRVFLNEVIALKRAGYPVLNSVAALNALKYNTWRCVDWLVDCANPDGSISQGCYLKTRADIDCTRCGFSPYTEISLAYRGNLQAVRAGVRIFF
jgi:Fe-coproporphyrin III synthase